MLTPFLRSLLERGLDISQGLLVVIDGSKGLRAAVLKAFRNRVVVHRCQWHYADLRIMPTRSLEWPRAAARVTLRSA